MGLCWIIVLVTTNLKGEDWVKDGVSDSNDWRVSFWMDFRAA